MPAALSMSLSMLFMLGTSVQVALANCPDDPEVDLCDSVTTPSPTSPTSPTSGTCPDDPEVDLCDSTDESPDEDESQASVAAKLHGTGKSSLVSLLFMAALRANDVKRPALALLLFPFANVLVAGQTCGDMKAVYKSSSCCGAPSTKVPFQIVPNPTERLTGSNPCDGKKALTQPGMDNLDCFKDNVIQAAEQAGGDVTAGFTGSIATSVVPITSPYYKTALCPVNVHWHLGSEHRSAGEYDEDGKSPNHAGLPADDNPDATRRLAAGARYGFACRKYDSADARFNTEYDWLHCKDMHVGETYEVHWPHSALGACGTPNQYQYPFYDGVFCGATAQLLGTLTPQDIANSVGVQAQVFTIINDDKYFYPDLVRGMIVDADNSMGVDIAAYTGSTTGTSRNNQICSAYAPITWQVDRKCHLISASSFDKMCADMKQMRDDMTGDLHPHGARELVWKNLTANNQQNQIPRRLTEVV